MRREVIFSSLELFIEKGLIDRLYSENGIEYKASENSTTFLDSLNELYSIELQNRSSWINSYIKDLSPELLQKQMINFIKNEG